MINCVAIDDEPIALSIIARFCDRFNEALVGVSAAAGATDVELKSFTSPRAGLEWVRENKPDVVFLDIEMNDTSGLAIAAQLPLGTLLIFTTAYAGYALEGFELNAIDFLHKPFSYGRFERALRKANYIIEARKINKQSLVSERIISVKVEYKNVQIPLYDILYVEAMDNYVRIYRLGGRVVVSQMTMKAMVELLPEVEFQRVHKSYIVAVSRILSFSRSQLVMLGEAVIPVGRSYANDLKIKSLALKI